MKTTGSVFFGALFIALAMVGRSETIAQDSLQEARSIVQRAGALQKEGQWKPAEDLLNEGLQKCTGAECRSVINFALGYQYEQMARVDTARRVDLLKRAAGQYERVLADFPGNADATYNLALVRRNLGEWEKAAKLLSSAPDLDDSRAGANNVLAGDLYFENGRFDDAMRCYQKSADARPSDEAVTSRILRTYRKLPQSRMADLSAYGLKLQKQNQMAAASDAFEQVVARSAGRDNALAEKALVSWTDIQASQGWISAESLWRLPGTSDWNSPAVTELRTLVEKPGQMGVSGVRWWKADRLRRHVTASVLKNVASGLLVKGEVDRAIAVYESALQVAPHFDEYSSSELRDKPLVILDIAQELASLYHRYSQAGGGAKFSDLEERFANVENMLFMDKMGAYRANDIPNIQRLHTVLGLIYAERGLWQSGGAKNAIFQLEHALQIADRRSREKGSQPLPHLQEALAKGYTAVGRTGDSFRMHCNAAMGYLDLDDPKRASSILDTVYALNYIPTETENNKCQAIRRITDVRMKMASLQADGFTDRAQSLLEDSPELQSKYSEYAESGLDSSFVKRQQFKVYSDLSARANRYADSSAASLYHKAAVSSIGKDVKLTSSGDVERIERAVVMQEKQKVQVNSTQTKESKKTVNELKYRHGLEKVPPK